MVTMLLGAMMATIVFVLWLGLGALTGSLAQNRGQSGVLWLVLGMVAPGLALIALLVFFVYDPGPDGEHAVPAPDEAARTNPVAQALIGRSGSTPAQLAERTDMSASAVKGDLRTLRSLGIARRGDDGRWQLTETGAQSVHT